MKHFITVLLFLMTANVQAATQNKIRLMGIDAPEKAQTFGDKSRQILVDSIAGKTVKVDYNKQDKYKRVVGSLMFQGCDITLRQVELGMAWHYKQYELEQGLNVVNKLTSLVCR